MQLPAGQPLYRKEGLYMKELTENLLDEFRKDYESDKKAKALTSAAASTDMAALAFVPAAAARLKGAFPVEVKTRGITAQKQSGRCWLFAALNIVRERIAEACHLESFECSQNYLSFYDKLEKANNFLDMVVSHAQEPLNGQAMQYILQGVTDGGYWTEAADLIEKYGVVPKSVQPETWQSEHTARFLSTINHLLRKDAMELRELVKAGKDTSARQKEMMCEVYKAECIAFGEPVKEFDFAFRDKDGKYVEERHMTPLAFYKKYAGLAIRDYMPVIHEPTEDKPLHRVIQFHGGGNMAGSDMKALHLTQEELEELCVKQLKAGDPVWFACDAGSFGARKEGVWDPDSVHYEDILGGFSTYMPKGKRLAYRNTGATHAMILTGVHFDEQGRPDRWKIENSWGKDVGEDGYFVCSETYFREFVYEAVIHKDHLTQEQKDYMKQEPVIIPAWDEDH